MQMIASPILLAFFLLVVTPPSMVTALHLRDAAPVQYDANVGLIYWSPRFSSSNFSLTPVRHVNVSIPSDTSRKVSLLYRVTLKGAEEAFHQRRMDGRIELLTMSLGDSLRSPAQLRPCRREGTSENLKSRWEI